LETESRKSSSFSTACASGIATSSNTIGAIIAAATAGATTATGTGLENTSSSIALNAIS